MIEYTFEKLGDSCEICVTEEHTFGTDAFLLADFASAKKKDVVCDLGTGCGIIATLIKLRYDAKEVYGIDIQEQAIEQFNMTVERSGFDNVHPIHMDLKALEKPAPLGECTLVTCNPPYKASDSGITNLSLAHKIARHEVMCNIDDVCKAAVKLLKFGGKLCLCNRPERLADVVVAMRNNGIEPKKIRFVSKSSDSQPWLFLIEGRYGGKPFLEVMPPLFMDSGNAISPELMNIFGGANQIAKS